MTIKIENASIETIVEGLIQDKIDVNVLNLSRSKDREAFLMAIKQRPYILKKVKKH